MIFCNMQMYAVMVDVCVNCQYNSFNISLSPVPDKRANYMQYTNLAGCYIQEDESYLSFHPVFEYTRFPYL